VDAVVRVEIEPAAIERAGKLMELLREEALDFRSLCAEHGVFYGKETGHRCPVCRPTPVEEAAPVPADIEF
jgi:hypothetical protein